MKRLTSLFRSSLTGLVVASLTAAVAPGCGLDEQLGEEVDETGSPIIGGSTVTVATRRSLGLVNVNGGCSGSLISRDWVITATHCLNFNTASSNSFAIPRANGALETRFGVAVEQVATTDVSIVQLGAPQAGSEWPNITRTVRPGNASTLVGQSMTCYGQGATAYNTPSGTGTGMGGIWKSLVRTVASLEDGVLFTNSTATGTETAAPGDSGGGCIVNGQNVAVASFVQPDCADPTNVNTCKATISKINRSGWRSTSEFADYIDRARLRAATATFRQLATPDVNGILNLQNGWTNHPFSTNDAQAALISNTVHLRGAIKTTGTNPVPFTLPVGLRPSADVYVPTNLCASTKGRLWITSAGVVTVQAEGGVWANAQCFTSLEGISFAINNASATNLTLQNSWVNSPFSTRPAAARVVNGIVRLQGAIRSGTTASPFTLPLGFRPQTTVYVPVDLCDAKKGRLIISSNGTLQIHAFGGLADAQCFTSLEGAWFAVDNTGSFALGLQNGWTVTTFGTRNPGIRNESGMIRFHGAMKTTGTNMEAFILPDTMRPATAVFTTIDLCSAQKGRLYIQPNGVVTVHYPTGALSSAQCFASLEGASFGL